MRLVPRVLLPALLTAVLLAGGCGDADEVPSAGGERRQHDAQGSRSPKPTPTPTEPAPTQTGAAQHLAAGSQSAEPEEGETKIAPTQLPAARPGGARSHLLGASTLPQVDDDTDWTVRATGKETSHPVGKCQKTPLVDIGAMTAVRRAFAGPDGEGLRARQVVARFADPKSAWRAHQVLRAWRDDCEERLDYPTKEVGPMQAVDLDAGAGGHYRATYGPKKDTDASGLGIVRTGRWLSIVAITATQDDYPASWTRRAVRRIAATFA